MPRRRRPLAVCATILVAVTVFSTLPASGHGLTKTDGNDTAGPLDLQSISVEHDDFEARFRFKTFKAWQKTTLGGDSYLLVAIDRDEDLVADRCLFIYYYGGALRGAMTNCGRRNLGVQSVEKPNGTTAWISTGITTLGGTHRWAAFSFFEGARVCKRGCLDSVPNRVPLLHDLVPPTPSWTTTTSGPHLSTQLSNTTTIPIQFDLADADTRVTDWRIDRVVNVFTGAVSALTSGTAPATGTDLIASEGETYILRLVATDLHGNIGSSPDLLRFGVPYDDANVIMEYDGSWTTTANTSYFSGGYHSTASAGDTLTFTFTSPSGFGQTHVRLLGGPGNGSATWTDGSGSANGVAESPSTPVGAVVAGWAFTGSVTKTLTLTVDTGTIIVDGIAVVMS